MLSRDEAEQDEMRVALDDARVKFLLGDIRDAASVNQRRGVVDFIFTAVAHKPGAPRASSSTPRRMQTT